MKKFIVGLLLLILVAVGVLFYMNGQDNYDASKYSASTTNGLNVGSKIKFTLPDQFDQPHSLTKDVKKLIFVFAKPTGHIVKEFLKKQDKNYLKNKKALFIADISPMPTVIRNTFALPDFRKSNYSVLLIYDEEMAKKFKEGVSTDKIVIITLNKGVVKKVDYTTNEEELIKKL
jgi:hypothetical protein